MPPWAGALCVALFVAFGGAPAALVYDRAAIGNGEIWRLATGHLVHLDLQHLGYNIGALLALGALYETASFGGPRRLVLGVLGFRRERPSRQRSSPPHPQRSNIAACRPC